MPRIQSHDYANPSYHPPSQDSFATIPPGLRSGFSPVSQSVSVVVRNPPRTTTDNTSESNEETPRGTNLSGGDHREAGNILGSDLYYAPMSGGVAPTSEGNGSALMMGSTGRGTKRRHNDDELDGDSSRQHRRLTTKEEVTLFEICNQNAETFGSRSNLCKWWISIATEFKRIHEGRSYSWHSVRRKVEMVTRQRIKYLEEQRQRGTATAGFTAEELMNPRWLAAVDAWIPTWQRWEEAENRRIAKRDELKKRRQPQPWGKNTNKKDQDAWRNLPGSSATSPPDVSTALGGILHQAGAASVDTTVPISPTPSPSITGPAPSVQFLDPPTPVPATTSLKLPPGFENMFSNPQLPPQVPPLPSVSGVSAPQSDGRMVSAVIETLGKLNRHLDAASGGNDASAASPVISALVQAASESSVLASPQKPQSQSQPQQARGTPITQMQIEQMKNELRQEMQDQFRQELEKERAAMDEKLDALQRTQDLILEMLRQEPA